MDTCSYVSQDIHKSICRASLVDIEVVAIDSVVEMHFEGSEHRLESVAWYTMLWILPARGGWQPKLPRSVLPVPAGSSQNYVPDDHYFHPPRAKASCVSTYL